MFDVTRRDELLTQAIKAETRRGALALILQVVKECYSDDDEDAIFDVVCNAPTELHDKLIEKSNVDDEDDDCCDTDIDNRLNEYLGHTELGDWDGYDYGSVAMLFIDLCDMLEG